MAFHRIKSSVGSAVLAKYSHRCTKCGSNDDLCVHHVIKMKPSDERYNDIENLTVLCRRCHMSHHRKSGDIMPVFTHGGVSSPGGRRGKNPPVKCIEKDCDRWQHGRSLCKKHYEYKRRHGLLTR